MYVWLAHSSRLVFAPCAGGRCLVQKKLPLTTETEVREWMEARGYHVFDSTSVQGNYRVMAEKDDVTIRAAG